VVFPAHTRVLRSRPFRYTLSSGMPCEKATAAETVSPFHTNRAKAATARPAHSRESPAGRPAGTTAFSTAPATSTSVAMERVLKAIFTGGRRAARWAPATAMGASSRSHGPGTSTRPTTAAASDQVKDWWLCPKRMRSRHVSPATNRAATSASRHRAGTPPAIAAGTAVATDTAPAPSTRARRSRKRRGERLPEEAAGPGPLPPLAAAPPGPPVVVPLPATFRRPSRLGRGTRRAGPRRPHRGGAGRPPAGGPRRRSGSLHRHPRR
jgi:hypothetical protein